MGLTYKHAGFITLAMASIALPLRRSPDPAQADTRDRRFVRLDSLMNRYQAAQRTWVAFELRDSALAVAAGAPVDGASPAIAWRGFTTPVAHRTVDSTVTALWHEVGASRSEVSTSVLIYNLAMFRKEPYTGTLVSLGTTPMRCVGIVPGDGAGDSSHVWTGSVSYALAPCALLARFGRPGAAMSAWLASTRFAAARSDNWLVPRTAKWEAGPWVEWFNRWPTATVGHETLPWLYTSGLLDIAAFSATPYQYGAAGVRCIAGDQQSCADGVLRAAVTFPDTSRVPADLVQEATKSWRDSVTIGTIRLPSERFISGMISTFGREKFQRFWSSEQPFEVAFQQAFGTSLGEWMARWAKDQWGRTYDAHLRGADMLLGVTLRPWWVVATVVWCGLGLWLSGWIATRRMV